MARPTMLPNPNSKVSTQLQASRYRSSAVVCAQHSLLDRSIVMHVLFAEGSNTVWLLPSAWRRSTDRSLWLFCTLQVHVITLPSGALLLAFDDDERLRTPLAFAMSKDGGDTW